jgi:hypothetical protein
MKLTDEEWEELKGTPTAFSSTMANFNNNK